MKDFSKRSNTLRNLMNKVAYAPPGVDPSAMGGLPPGVDPSAMGGLPPGVDPSAMGGLPPGVDPSAMGGLPPGVDPSAMGGLPPGVDPSMLQGQPPVDPSMGGLPPGVDPSMGGLPPGVDPSMGGLPPGVDPSMGGLPPGVDPASLQDAPFTGNVQTPPSDSLTVSKADLMDILQEAGMSGINEGSGSNMDSRLSSLENMVSAIAGKLGVDSPQAPNIDNVSNAEILPPEDINKTASVVDLYKRNVIGDRSQLISAIQAVFI